jgi:hypothetical protein
MATLMMVSKQATNQLQMSLILRPPGDLRYTEFHRYVQFTLNADLHLPSLRR